MFGFDITHQNFDFHDSKIPANHNGVPILLDPNANSEGLVFFASKGMTINTPFQIRVVNGIFFLEPYDEGLVQHVTEEIRARPINEKTWLPGLMGTGIEDKISDLVKDEYPPRNITTSLQSTTTQSNPPKTEHKGVTHG